MISFSKLQPVDKFFKVATRTDKFVKVAKITHHCMSSLHNGHCRDVGRCQGANVDDGADDDAVDFVKADKEVKGEDGVRYER